MKKFFRYLRNIIIFILSFILLYFGFAWLFSRIGIKREAGQPSDITYYLKTNGVHTDIIVPVKTSWKDWSINIPSSHTRSADTSLPYIAFGWGDRAFYLETPTWGDLKARTAFNAAFGLSRTAMHITFYRSLQEDENCVKRSMGNDQYKRLIEFIETSFSPDSSGRPIVIPTEARYGQHDSFYEATGTYSLFHTCNTWTNNALKASGQRACWWTPFDWGIFYQYRQTPD